MNKFDDTIIAHYEKYQGLLGQFRVNLTNRKVFICGGPVLNDQIDCSFRQRFIIALNSNVNYILAEDFKDYLKDNNYSDLLSFEDDIAHLSSIIMIFLESPGSLVELGMFITKPNFYKKILIVAPRDEIELEDSFIYLGPIEHIKKKHNDSVTIYPWPEKGESYDNTHIQDLKCELENKLSKQIATQSFNKDDVGHLSFLIVEIIRLSYPIILDEIELSLLALDMNILQSRVKSLLYLLNKLGYIGYFRYSRYKYYYPMREYKSIPFVNFGSNKDGVIFDEGKYIISLKRSYILGQSESDKKRAAASKEIIKLLE